MDTLLVDRVVAVVLLRNLPLHPRVGSAESGEALFGNVIMMFLTFRLCVESGSEALGAAVDVQFVRMLSIIHHPQVFHHPAQEARLLSDQDARLALECYRLLWIVGVLRRNDGVALHQGFLDRIWLEQSVRRRSGILGGEDVARFTSIVLNPEGESDGDGLVGGFGGKDGPVAFHVPFMSNQLDLPIPLGHPPFPHVNLKVGVRISLPGRPSLPLPSGRVIAELLRFIALEKGHGGLGNGTAGAHVDDVIAFG